MARSALPFANGYPIKNKMVDFEVGADLKVTSGKIVTSENMTDYNDFGKEEQVRFADFKTGRVKDGKLHAEIPAHSVVLIQLHR
ncbi:MAG: hypothetical protein JXQ96_06755 [Cyclobacteriaceae bacterium]